MKPKAQGVFVYFSVESSIKIKKIHFMY